MSQPEEQEPLVHSVEVRCSQSAAFNLWVGRPSTWWPIKDHSTFGEDAEAIVIELRVEGRIYERNGNGETRDWGRLTEWDPPALHLLHVAHLRSTRRSD